MTENPDSTPAPDPGTEPEPHAEPAARTDQEQQDSRPQRQGPEESPESARARAALLAVRDEVGKAVVGQHGAVSGLMVALLARGHVLLEGVPGVAKTLLIRSLAAALDVQTKRVQFTPDLMPGDLTGSLVFDNRTSDFEFREGPVFTNLLLADEINRTPRRPSRRSSRRWRAAGQRRRSAPAPAEPVPCRRDPEPDRVRRHLSAARGPSRPVPPRSSVRVEREQEIEVLHRHATGFDPARPRRGRVRPVAGIEDLRPVPLRSGRSRSAPTSSDTSSTSPAPPSPSLSLGVSPRGATALLTAARAWVAVRPDVCHPDDVKALAQPTLAHRLSLTPRPSSRA